MSPQWLAFDLQIKYRQMLLAQICHEKLIEPRATKGTVRRQAEQFTLHVLTEQVDLVLWSHPINRTGAVSRHIEVAIGIESQPIRDRRDPLGVDLDFAGCSVWPNSNLQHAVQVAFYGVEVLF